jgi:hypothetical protein
MPVWGLWLDGAFYFSAGRLSRKTRNLATNSSCAVATERADEAVIVEGMAREVADQVSLRPFYDAYKAKYGWDMEQEPFVREPIFAVRPDRVFAFTEKDLSGSATRWVFGEADDARDL